MEISASSVIDGNEELAQNLNLHHLLNDFVY